MRKWVANLVIASLTRSLPCLCLLIKLNTLVDVFGDAFGMLYSVLDPILFAYDLKHEVYAMCRTWSLEYGFMFFL